MRFTLVLSALVATAMAGSACIKHPKKHCETPQGKGLCMDVRDCKGKGTSVPGYCPGGVNFQCCVKDKGDESSTSEYPTSTADTAESTYTTDAPDTTDATYTTYASESTDSTYTTDTQESSKGHHTKSHHSKTAHTKTHQSQPTGETTMKTQTMKPKPKPTTTPQKPKDGGGHIDDAGLHLIESEEGWRANFYTINGDRTIGYGHDCTQKGDCSSIHAPLSKAEGQQLLAKDVHGFESCVCQLPHAAKLNQNQFNALVSFTYNSGCGGVARYFKSYMSKSDFNGICSDLPHTNTLGGELTGRRTRESQLCKQDTNVMSGC